MESQIKFWLFWTSVCSFLLLGVEEDEVDEPCEPWILSEITWLIADHMFN